jgi:hypothetical protein
VTFSLPLRALAVTWSDDTPARVRLEVPLTQWSTQGELTAPRGFVCDGASIPRAVRWFHDPFDPRTLRAAIVHDLRCTAWPLEGERYHIGTWQDAHEAFAYGCEVGGLTGLRFDLVTRAVKRFGPRWPASRVIPVADAVEFLARFPFDWHPSDARP